MYEKTAVINNNQAVGSNGKRTTTRKIGKCTYIISSSFKESKQCDIVSALIWLIQNENTVKSGV